MTLDRAFELILGNLGVLVLLLFILFGGYRRWWVWGWYARELQASNVEQERRLDRALAAGTAGTGLASRAVDVAEHQHQQRQHRADASDAE